LARGYVMTPWGVFEAKKKPLQLPKADAPADAAEPALAADAPAEGGELGAVVAAEEPFQWAPGEPLSNFSARVVLDIEEHAPEETRRAFELACMVGGAPQTIRIPAEEFPSMGWVPKRLGSEAIIEAGRDTKDRLRAAIQHLSMPVPKKAVHTCTGWRDVAGRPVYLSGTGGLGADGPVAGVEVQLAAALRAFALPPPIEGTALGTALERAAELFLLSASGPAVALFGAVWRAPLEYSPLVVYLSGAPKAGKTYLAAIAQSFYGAGDIEMRPHLPVINKSVEEFGSGRSATITPTDVVHICNIRFQELAVTRPHGQGPDRFVAGLGRFFQEVSCALGVRE
jgi:hypothetical protein